MPLSGETNVGVRLPQAGTAHLTVEPVGAEYVLKDRIYESLKRAIASIDIYAMPEAPRLDKRQLAKDLGVSRTPIREALARLEQEGLVSTIPRRGVFVVRKTKREVIEMIWVWAVLEGLAARLITQNGTAEDIASLRRMFGLYENGQVQANIDEYSESNIQFHQTIIRLSKSELIGRLTENLFIHMRWIRRRTISQGDRAQKSIIDHMHIIEALEARDTELAERLVRQHNYDLAAHVERTVDYLD